MPRYALRSLSVLGLVAVVAAIVGAQAPSLAPTKVDGLTAQVVVRLLEGSHMAHPTIDDATAVQWAKTYLRELDPRKYYFLKSDVDEFMAQAPTLDDNIREGNVEFARLVFDRYLKRSDERYAEAIKILDGPVDFTADESIADDPDKFSWPADEKEANDRLRKQIKFQLLVDKVAKEPVATSIPKIKIQYKDRNRNVHQFKHDDVLEVYLSSLTKTFDPHSSYLNKSSFDELMNSTLHLSLTGIGAVLESVDGYPTIKELIPSGPAEKDGRLQEEDKIVGIQKPDGEEVSFIEKRLNDVVKQIRGEVNTKVRLIIQSKGMTEKKIYELTRQKVELVQDHAKGQVIETSAEGKPLKIGVIRLPAFYGDTAAVMRGDPDAVSATVDCRRLIDEFKKQGVNSVMIDLRENGGGLLSEAVTLSGLFINKGPVVQVKDSTGVRTHEDEDEGTAWDGPLVVLIDHRSASASEIFAGVIKDYGRGLIVGGSSTFGKGTVQQIVPINEQLRLRNSLPEMGALKLTIQQFYRANGESTQVKGVAPDIKIPSLFDQLDDGEDKLDHSLKFDKIDAVAHDQLNRVPTELIARLQSRSEARRHESEKFRKLEDAIKKINERKAKHQITLNEAKYRGEMIAEDEEKNELNKDKKKERRKYGDHAAWESNYYSDEIVKIVADYLTLDTKIFAAVPTRSTVAN